ncbi:hypothetical protein VPHF101_0009 [Vibrio phage F101]
MYKITEEEYYNWRNKQLDTGMEYQVSKILSALGSLLMDTSGSMVVKGFAVASLACNCRFLLEDYGLEMDTKYKWKELFEVEL